MKDAWLNRLSEYLDDELDRTEREGLETHLASCSECATTLADLRRVRARARDLTNAPVPSEIWTGIENAIAERKNVPFPTNKARTRHAVGGWSARTFSLPELVAACLGIAILSGGTVFAVLQGRESKTTAPLTAPAQVITRAPETAGTQTQTEAPAATQPSERETRASAVLAEKTPQPTGRIEDSTKGPESPHEEAIAELRKALAKQRDRLDPATVRTLEANLTIIDLAIDQARRALDADPANTYVREHLAETMRRKVELLQRATMLASASPEGR